MNRPSADGVLDQCVLGRYRILRTLARGGMGAVYLARTEGAEGFTRPVVIKRVLPALMDDPEVAQLFVREARLLANLQHPNIVGVLDFGQQSDAAYLTVFEYVSGYSLAQWERFVRLTRGQAPIDIALHIVGLVLDALHYAHTFRRGDGKPMQIIHRDVSPSNILLSEQGTVKLLDFGIAQVSGQEAEAGTQRPRIRGKLPYVPIEIFKGQPATVQSDIYSAGVVLYELITGTNPFAGRETADIYHKVLTVTPPSVHAARDDAPEELDQVIARALDRDPQRRYASAAEFAQALRALRRLPEEQVAQQLAAELRHDFASLPETLGIEGLAAREAAWRTSMNPPAADAMSDQSATVRPPGLAGQASAHEAVTVHAEVSPALLEAAAREAPASHPVASATRLAWVAGLAGLAGAIATAGAWLVISASAPAPVVVIERPPAAAPDKRARSTGQSGPPEAAAATPAIAPAEAPASPTEPPKSGEPETEREPAAPSARALTRAFERRQDRVASCFDRHAAGLAGQPQLSVHFRVGKGGEVLGAELEPAALAGTSLGSCLIDVARTTRFRPQQRELSFHIPITARQKAD